MHSCISMHDDTERPRYDPHVRLRIVIISAVPAGHVSMGTCHYGTRVRDFSACTCLPRPFFVVVQAWSAHVRAPFFFGKACPRSAFLRICRSPCPLQAMEHFNAPGSSDFAFLLSTRRGRPGHQPGDGRHGGHLRLRLEPAERPAGHVPRAPHRPDRDRQHLPVRRGATCAHLPAHAASGSANSF